MTRAGIIHAATVGLITGILIGFFDTVELLHARDMFFDTREMLLAATHAIFLNAAFGTLFFAFLYLLKCLKKNIFRGVGFTSWGFRTASVGAVLFGPFIYVLLMLTSGPQASQIRGRSFIVLSIAALSALSAAALIELAPSWIDRSHRRRIATVIGSLSGAALLHYMDATVLVRLYPLFHYLLTLLAFLLGGLGCGLIASVIQRRFDRHLRLRILLIACAATIGAGGLSLASVLYSQNIRYVIGQKTGAATDIIAITKVFRPSPAHASGSADNSSGSADNAVMILDGLQATQPSVASTIIRPGADIFLITVDAMRYDRLRITGATQQVMPNLDRFAEKSIVFTKGYTPIPHTSYAISSLMTGKYTRPLFDVPGAPAVHETWPEILRGFRYETSAFFPPAVFFIDKARFQPYYRKGLGFLYKHVDARVSAKEKISLLIDHVRKKKQTGRPHFSWIHFFEAHEPYDPQCTRFGNSKENRYDCELNTVDTALLPLFEYIEKECPDALVIVTADHGEAFGEHGDHYHGTSLHDEQVRVPIIMKIPGISHKIIDAPVNLVDLLGTTTRILDIPTPARVRSRDLRSLITGGASPAFDAFSEVHEMAMLVRDNHKLICDVEADLCRLYDLNADPGETRSVSEQYPKQVAELKKRLQAWRASHARFELRPVGSASDKASDEKRWPEAIRDALAGDVSAVDKLVVVLTFSNETLFRRKSAELIYRMAEEFPPFEIAPAEDNVVAAWLYSLQARLGDKSAIDSLSDLAETLSKDTPVAQTVLLSRLSLGDRRVIRDTIELVLSELVPIETRRNAVRLLAKLEKESFAAVRLIPLINNYQLTLDVSELFGRHEVKTAVAPLVVRLKRERFPERKAAVIDALAAIGEWSAVAPISDQLYLESPPPNVLHGLNLLVGHSPYGRSIPTEMGKRKHVFFNPVVQNDIKLNFNKIHKVIVRTKKNTQAFNITLTCNDTEIGRIESHSSPGETAIDARACPPSSRGSQFHLRLSISTESDLESGNKSITDIVESVVVLGPPSQTDNEDKH